MPSAPALRAIAEMAGTSPSSHNTQPWRFRARGAALELWADRTRALPVNDPHDRELTISCGAALLSLRVAVASLGRAAQTHLLPDGPAADRLARVEIGSGAADVELAGLSGYLPRRRTHRPAFAGRRVSADAMRAIEQAVVREGAALVSLEGGARERAAALVAEGDRVQWHDPRWRRELALWMRQRRRGDGLTVPWLAAPLVRTVVRTVDMGKGVAAKDRQLAASAPWLTVLTTDTDDVAAWLGAGQALQRALLEGCRLGLQAGYLNQPIQVEALRPRLQALLETAAHPQLLIRWGYPVVDLRAAPRRRVDDVFDFRPG